MLDPVRILEQRRDFLKGIIEVATTCNWSEEDIAELQDCLWESLVEIDNSMFDTYVATEDRELARAVWESRMEDLRHWLGMIFGIKIRYV